MRIALIVPGGVDRSGEYRIIPALLTLIGRLSRHNDVHVIALGQEAQAGEWDLAGARIYNIGSRHTRLGAIRLLRSLHRLKRFDVVQAIWSGTSGLIAVTAGKLLGIPSLIHVAGGELVALHEIGYGGRLTWRGRLREALTLRGASAITAASAPIIDSLKALGFAAQRLPLGVDLEVWPTREPVRRHPGSSARLIHVASLNGVKDQPTLLRALAALEKTGTSFEMEIVGEDTLHGEIQRLAARLGLADRIRFRGFLTVRQLRPVVEAADLMIISSRHEAGPLAMLEAAATGVPTVGTAVGHVTEWTPDAALAVPVGDWGSLAGAIRQVLNDEDLRLRLAREALKRAAAENADYTARRFEELYRSLV
ncbi:MAG: hexosyltransferase [Gammaproteobacteria bacterium]|nr:hexosyltransferase [Gammaproteobacteria bacterium]